jgi:hypothetical protein
MPAIHLIEDEALARVIACLTPEKTVLDNSPVRGIIRTARRSQIPGRGAANDSLWSRELS